tara:strand:- start:551 stop:1609 length:1059 start_codon:yes stop_codon:yes gene_type:complete
MVHHMTVQDAQVVETDGMKDLPAVFIKESHKLIFSQLRLTPIEHDLFALFLARLNKEHWESFRTGKSINAPVYVFANDVLSQWFDEDVQGLYSLLKEPAQRLINRSIGITDGDSFQFLSLFKKVKYKKGDLTLIPNDLLMNEFLGVSHGHAQVPHQIFRKLKREYSKRIYTILCRFQSDKTVLHDISIDNLHAYLGLLDVHGNLSRTSYSRVTELVDRIIKPAIEEIDHLDPNITFNFCENKKTYGFELKRKKRKVVAIKFLFSWYIPSNKKEKKLREDLQEEKSSYQLALETYTKVQSIELESSTDLDITSAELHNLMANSPELQQNNYRLEESFMLKFSKAMTFAKLKSS